MSQLAISRREFIKLCAAVGGGLSLPWEFDLQTALASVQFPQTPLAGKSIPKFVEPLPVFGPAGPIARVSDSMITVTMSEVQQKVLPASLYGTLPAPYNQGTYVWAYKVGSNSPLFPGVTVEAKRGTPTTITYVNNLPVAGPVLEKYLTIDQTIHWAAPLGMNMTNMSPYTGPIPTVAHLHGAEVTSLYDGGPEQWFTASGIHGSAYATLTNAGGDAAVYQYPNGQEATTLWFHDHTLGATRINVYAGLAAFYLLRDQYDTGLANNPLHLPAGPYEIEMALQDRQVDTNGQWYFPDGSGPGLNDTPPNPTVHPFWIPEFFGDVMVVNGKSWPYLEVEPRRYRFRLLDGCNARMLELRLMNRATNKPGPGFWQIGTDGGLLDKPTLLNDPTKNNAPRFFFAPGERADIIVDFSGYAGQTLTLVNSAKAPYPSGTSPDPQTNGQLMQFRVTKPLNSQDTTYNPASGASLRGGANQMPLIVRLGNPIKKRQLVLKEDEGPGGPLEVLVNNTKWTGKRENTGQPIPGYVSDGHGDYLSELPQVGSTEQWEIINLTMDAHPIHLHLVQFQLLNRQGYKNTYDDAWEAAFPGGVYIAGYGPPKDYFTANADGALGGNPAISPYLQGPILPPEPNELGWKDTVKMYPGQVTRILVRWAPQDIATNGVSAGQNKYSFDPTVGPGYVWHCHIIDHEDNEMMRPYHPV